MNQARVLYCVILAGGDGERLWPLSRQKKPKQLLTIDGCLTLLEKTVERIAHISFEKKVIVSTTQQHAEVIEEHIGHLVDAVWVEPESRNTAPAVLFSCLKIKQQEPHAIVMFFPADSFIFESDIPLFTLSLEHAIHYAAQYDVLTIFGVPPIHPAIEYGYITYKKQGIAPYIVSEFIEKPSLAVAQNYYAQEDVLWNIGILCASVAVIEQEFIRHASDVISCMQHYFENNHDLYRYKQLPYISIDRAILEKSHSVAVLPLSINWYDVGNIETFLLLQQKQQENAQVITINADNNLVSSSGKRVVLIGVDDLCVVNTDDVLFITKRGQSEKVKMLVHQLKQENQQEYL
ncbi:MAG TPA: sugar phosphate nucleotidyltransferase [Candidatus Babeliales bacterium]|nr:sugar phosphate nucleotidyltransferase [Candidatus Babeliales bacterium]